MATESSTTQSIRRPYTGSCHCGFTKYILYLTLPPTLLSGQTGTAIANERNSVRLRKCNCTTCHKMGFFHVRTPQPAQDFMLLSPLDPMEDLSGYTCNGGGTQWFFCKTCGVRCFAFEGNAEVVTRDVDGEERKTWKPVDGHSDTKAGYYLSVNAQTLDAGQEGLDLREWYEKKWVYYLDMLDEEGKHSFERPHRGGTF